MPERTNTVQIRIFLRKVYPRFIDAQTADVLERSLPKDWQQLIWAYGREPVFDCLRRDYTLGGAKWRLR